MIDINELIQPNKAVKVFFGKGNVNNHKAHIRAVVDGEYIVYRVWLKIKQRWDYRIDHISWFRGLCDKGYLEAA